MFDISSRVEKNFVNNNENPYPSLIFKDKLTG